DDSAGDGTATEGVTDGTEEQPDIDEPEDNLLRIDSVDPSVGRAKGGDIITVMGNGFGKKSTVIFGESQAFDIFIISSTRLTCTTPPGNPGLVDVTVQNTDTGVSAVLESGYRYESDVLILSVDPPEGHLKGGEPVTIKGSGFSQGIPAVLLGGSAAINVQVVDDMTLHFTTPAASKMGPVDLFVSNEQGLAVLKDGFFYYNLPTVDTVVPAAGSVDGGTEVTLSGDGFVDGAKVYFGEIESPKSTFVDANTLKSITPPGAEGAVDVIVETQYGAGGIPGGYIYVSDASQDTTQVLAVQPNSGPVDGGQSVIITAYGLIDDADTQVTIGGQSAEIVAIEPSKLAVTVLTPAGTVGAADVTVSSSNGTDTLNGGYTYEPGLGVEIVDPALGPQTGGTPITITGTGFVNGANVRIGALPCANVVVENENTITCKTPPGSPGSADVTVNQGAKSTSLTDGFFYQSDGVALYVVDPPTGSQAGGTFVRLMGAGFVAPAGVTFDGNSATHVKVESSTLITCKSPPGEVGAVDVAISGKTGDALLPESFAYFDPMALYGGTWGPGVDEAVNVTVLDGGNGNPLPDAFVMLKVDPDTPYQGFTNSDGQITFSGKDVMGEQMVSASKEGYASNSVIAFDATNITIYLIPTPPPSMGPPPPGATVSGKVFGLGKYVVPPPGDCTKINTAGLPSNLCQPCASDDDCPDSVSSCTVIGDTGSFCTSSCIGDVNCPKGFSCLNAGAKASSQCVPTPGTKQARCYTSIPQIFSQKPEVEEPFIVNPDGTYKFGSRLGEVAIVCLGGVVDWNETDNTKNFTPLAFGVKRHVFVLPGENPGNDITLNHPLTRSIKIRLDEPPFDQTIGPEYNAALVYWDFGSDGVFFHRTFQDVAWGNSNEVLQIERQPTAFTGDVYDATFTLLGISFSYSGPGSSQLPVSYTLQTDLKNIEDDVLFKLEAGQWKAVHSGVTKTINALHGFSDSDVWGVGDNGIIIHSSGIGWALQAAPTKEHLYGVWGSAGDDIWAVGASGTVLHFNGINWAVSTIPNVSQDLRAVWGTGPTDVYAVAASWGGIHHWDGTAWTKTNASGADLRDIHGADGLIWGVGRYGNVRFFDGNTWKYQQSSTSQHLYSVHAVSATEAYAVGAGGTIIQWDGTVWKLVSSPTNRTLRAVWAAGADNVYAVGDGSVLLHYDGNSWVDQTLPNQVSTNALLGLWGNSDTGYAVSLGASEVLMGPMLQVPEQQNPADGATLEKYYMSFAAKPGVPAHFNYITVAIPTLFGDVPVWFITTDGDVFEFDLPDFPNIEGTPGIASGELYKLTIIRVYKDNFDIDNYDFTDFSTLKWRSWAVDVTYFTK
ncbi:MAG TPA: hypothetical protein EYN66_12580, partial [Myxococcales bacterium]|nr:hypothetical protein [Myxococcales bacterium]